MTGKLDGPGYPLLWEYIGKLPFGQENYKIPVWQIHHAPFTCKYESDTRAFEGKESDRKWKEYWCLRAKRLS